MSYDANIGFIQSSLFKDRGISHGFSTRAFHLSDYTGIIPQQSHTHTIVEVTDRHNTLSDTDGLITAERALAIGVKTADCVPILFADTKLKIVGVSHQGWKGTADNMAEKMIGRIVQKGTSLNAIIVAIGPSIGPCCYEVYGARLELFKDRFRQYADQVIEKRSTKTYLNLPLLNYLHLLNAGVLADNIDRHLFCTKCDQERFFSLQREGKGCNHMISYIMVGEKL